MFYPFWFDPTFIILIPGLILSLIAQASVQGTFSKYSKVISSTGETGAEFARRMLSSLGLYDVRVEAVSGFLTDHYDPRNKVLRLSAATYSSRSVAALGVVAHEVGHAMQHQENYLPLVLRNFSVPFAAIGSNLSWIIFIIGFLFYSQPLIQLGIILFSFAVLFTLITLPVEFNASSRAIKTLPLMGMPTSEVVHVKKVLGAAAMTYVASAAMAILQLLRMIMIAGMFGDRD
ncbi:zinc metallopeptidase [Marinitoga sp. 38H-ov]|uniref:zinc metallopeptidase n=1 Tax=Marinitoga sp. 38H-ov TaxID=1755814 RepID=UPI0013ECF96C|nr:zinc metallopeptidase [Marinitoga sp. 38H-ov]KAF2956815.1 peptidase [Marinitoga sp. 38H-ov]